MKRRVLFRRGVFVLIALMAVAAIVLVSCKDKQPTEAPKSEYLTFELNDDKKSYSVSCNNDEVTEISIPFMHNWLPVTRIAESGFNAVRLETLTIPSSIRSIGDWAFEHCDSLERVNYGGTIGDWCGIELDGGGAIVITQVRPRCIMQVGFLSWKTAPGRK